MASPSLGGSPLLQSDEDLDLDDGSAQPPSCPIADHARFSEGRVIGQGSFGLALSFRDAVHGGARVAVKLQPRGDRVRREAYNEARVHHAVVAAMLGRDRASAPDLARDSLVCGVPLLLGFSRCRIDGSDLMASMEEDQRGVFSSALAKLATEESGKGYEVIEAEFVEGDTLGAHLDYRLGTAQDPGRRKPGYAIVHSLEDFASVWTTLLCTLSYLERTTALQHGDLHMGNIMIERLSGDGANRPARYRVPIVDVLGRVTEWVFYARPRYRVKLIDFGLARIDLRDSSVRHSFLYQTGIAVRDRKYYDYRADLPYVAAPLLFLWSRSWAERPPTNPSELEGCTTIARILLHAVGRTMRNANGIRSEALYDAVERLFASDLSDGSGWQALCKGVGDAAFAVASEAASCARVVATGKAQQGCDQWNRYEKEASTPLGRLRRHVLLDEHLVLFSFELNGYHERLGAGERRLPDWVSTTNTNNLKADFQALAMFPGAGEACSFREARNRPPAPATFLYPKSRRFAALFSKQLDRYLAYRRTGSEAAMGWVDAGYAQSALLGENTALYEAAKREWEAEDDVLAKKRPQEISGSIDDCLSSLYRCARCGQRARVRAHHEGYVWELPFCDEACSRLFCKS
jgi:hypothetical protein